MKTIKRWHKRTYHIAGDPIDIEIKALSKADTGPFLREMAKIGKVIRNAGDSADPSIALSFLESGFARDWFGNAVRPAEELQNEDGQRITNGLELFDEVSSHFVLRALLDIQNIVVLTEAEGKDSGSPSTSSVGGGSTESFSSGGVPSTNNGAGTAPSTVTETPTFPESSIPPGAM